MQILIGSAKKMKVVAASQCAATTSTPHFNNNAEAIAAAMASYSVEELQVMLGVNRKIALENMLRYKGWCDGSTLTPAVMAYDGMVFNRLGAESMTADELRYAQEHLFIASFLYGLLRPLDAINGYRLEGKVTLPSVCDGSMFDYWKPLLTDYLIEKVKADDGVLVNLASNEFRNMFDWRRVTESLTVVSPEFKVEESGRLKNVTIYAKMCRGAMSRLIISQRMADPSLLLEFNSDGFYSAGGWQFVKHVI